PFDTVTPRPCNSKLQVACRLTLQRLDFSALLNRSKRLRLTRGYGQQHRHRYQQFSRLGPRYRAERATLEQASCCSTNPGPFFSRLGLFVFRVPRRSWRFPGPYRRRRRGSEGSLLLSIFLSTQDP